MAPGIVTGVRRVLLPLMLVVAVALVWEWAVARYKVSPMILAAPSAVWGVFSEHYELLLKHLRPTAIEALTGFAIAVTTGIMLGTAVALSRRIRQAIYPHIVIFQLIPKIALAPLFILWFGIGMEARLVFITFMAFFPLVVSTIAGLIATPPNLLQLCRAVRASEWQAFVHVRFPHALPHIFAGMKIGATMAIIGAVVAEFITAQAGLGYVIMFGSSAGETAVVFAAIALLCAIGVTLFGTVAGAERLVRRRMHGGTQELTLV